LDQLQERAGQTFAPPRHPAPAIGKKSRGERSQPSAIAAPKGCANFFAAELGIMRLGQVLEEGFSQKLGLVNR
jgi:hypothetical protein